MVYPILHGFYTFQVLQDFFRQQYILSFSVFHFIHHKLFKWTQPLDFHMLTPSEKKRTYNTLRILETCRGKTPCFWGTGAGVSRLEGLVVSIGVRILRAPASHGGQKHGNFTFAVGPSVTWHMVGFGREGRQKRSPATSPVHLKITSEKGTSSSTSLTLGSTCENFHNFPGFHIILIVLENRPFMALCPKGKQSSPNFRGFCYEFWSVYMSPHQWFMGI